MNGQKAAVVELSRGGTVAKINMLNSQLFGLARKGTDVMWKGGAPEGQRPSEGWQNSEIVMFPIVGAAYDGAVRIGGSSYPVAQHGMARDLPWNVQNLTDDTLVVSQAYEAMTAVRNGKRASVFPRSYTLVKTYSIDERGALTFRLEVQNRSEEPLPFAAGWHPAFNITPHSGIKNDKQEVVLVDEVAAVDKNAVVFQESHRLSLMLNDGVVVILTHNFGRAQAWSTGPYVALEPITATSLSKDFTGAQVPPDLMTEDSYRKLARVEQPMPRYEATVKISK